MNASPLLAATNCEILIKSVSGSRAGSSGADPIAETEIDTGNSSCTSSDKSTPKANRLVPLAPVSKIERSNSGSPSTANTPVRRKLLSSRSIRSDRSTNNSSPYSTRSKMSPLSGITFENSPVAASATKPFEYKMRLSFSSGNKLMSLKPKLCGKSIIVNSPNAPLSSISKR